MPPATSARRDHALSLAVTLAIAIALLAPLPPPESLPGAWSVPEVDKLVHGLLFLAAAHCWRRSLARLGVARPALASLAAAAAYAGLLELAQGLWTSRTPELADLLAGVLGALVARFLP